MTFDARQALQQRFVKSCDEVFLVAPDGRRLTYAQVWANAKIISDEWAASGARPGDRIALVTPNDPTVPCCILAAAIGGFAICPITPDLTEGSIEEILKLIDPVVVIRDPPSIDFEIPAVARDEIAVAAAPEDWFVTIFTSGTTGQPKGICHSLNSMIGGACSFGTLSGMTPRTRLYHVLPMSYMAGLLNTILAPMMAGGRVILGPAFSATSGLDFWRRPSQEEVNFLIMTPSIATAVTRLTRDREAARRIIEPYTGIQTTAGRLTSGLRAQFQEAFGKPLQDCYGVTELGGPFTTQTPEDARFREDVGHPIPELDIDIRNGHLWLRTPFTMLGYLTPDGVQPPELDASGYMNTGDIAEFADGRLAITGRAKDLIIRGGVNISPIALENAVSGLDGIDDVAVIGAPHPFWGEQVVVCIEPGPGSDERKLESAVKDHCREHLSKLHQPDVCLILDAFPRAMNGKIQKHRLRDYVNEKLNG